MLDWELHTINFTWLVQNFENKDTIWNQPITYNNIIKDISISGQIKAPETNFSKIIINYDPVPSKQTYDDSNKRESYDSGKEIAMVVKDVPYHYNEFSRYNASNIYLLAADKWQVQNQNSSTVFDVSFSLQNLIENY